MAPAKFDDFSKTAKDVLTEDYATKGVGVKSKHATKFEGLTDIMGGGDGKSGATITTATTSTWGRSVQPRPSSHGSSQSHLVSLGCALTNWRWTKLAR